MSTSIKEVEVDPDVFEQLLQFLYTDMLSEGAVEARGEELLLGATKLGCDGLKVACES